MSLKQDENCYSTKWGGEAVVMVWDMEVRVREVACLLSFSCFSVLLWQYRLAQLLISLKPALSSGAVVGFSLLTYQKTQEEKWSVS